MNKTILLFFLTFLSGITGNAFPGSKEIQLEEIWKNGVFGAK